MDPIKMSESQEIQRGITYQIPAGANLVGARNGKIAFFQGDNDLSPKQVSRSHWRYWPIKEGCHYVYFSSFEQKSSGWCYENPIFA